MLGEFVRLDVLEPQAVCWRLGHDRDRRDLRNQRVERGSEVVKNRREAAFAIQYCSREACGLQHHPPVLTEGIGRHSTKTPPHSAHQGARRVGERKILRPGQDGPEQPRADGRVLSRIGDHKSGRSQRAHGFSADRHAGRERADEAYDRSVRSDIDAGGEVRLGPGILQEQLAKVSFEASRVCRPVGSERVLEQSSDGRQVLGPERGDAAGPAVHSCTLRGNQPGAQFAKASHNCSILTRSRDTDRLMPWEAESGPDLQGTRESVFPSVNLKRSHEFEIADSTVRCRRACAA
jgi:hypothetical protein